MDHPADRGQLGIVERVGRVVGRVIAGVFAGREEEERDASAAERAVVAPIEDQEVGAEQADGQRAARAPPRRSRGADPGACSVPITKTCDVADAGQRRGRSCRP